MTMKKRVMRARTVKAERPSTTKRGRHVTAVVAIKTQRSLSLRRSLTTDGEIVGPILGDWDVDRDRDP